MFKNLILPVSVAAALLAPLSAQDQPATEAPVAEAATNPALNAILEHVPAILDHSWKSTFHIQAFEGETPKMEMTAAVQYQDTKHFSVDIQMSAEDEFGEQKDMSFLILSDGAFLYLNSPNMAEMSQGMANGPIKVDLATLTKLMQMQLGGGMNPSGGEFNAEAMKGFLNGALEGYTFKEDGSGEGLRRYTLSGEGVEGFIAFEKEHWFLSGLEMKFDEGKAVVDTSDNAVVESFPEGTFTFTVAEGETVMDLTPMLQMSLANAPGAEEAEDDLEF